MHKRIFGIEREVELYPSAVFHMADISAIFRSLLPHTRDGARIIPRGSEFLANGGRAYVDTGLHPEISTPECASVRDCVIWDKAGERILEDIAACMNGGIRHSDIGRILPSHVRAKFARLGGITFLKTNAGPSADQHAPKEAIRCPSWSYASWGSHLNMLLDKREVSKYDAASVLGPFCFSSAWLTGSGMVWMRDGGRMAYALSQRLPYVRALHSIGAQGFKKPMFKFNDRMYADAEKYYRLQCVGLDSSVCEWQTYVPLGIMAIMLRMIEDRAITANEYRATDDELFTMKERTLWWGMERGLFIFRGETHTAPSLHRKYYLEPILAFKASGVSWSSEEEDLVQKYEFLIGAFEQARSSLELARICAPYIGWAAKLWYLMLPHMRENGYSFTSAPNFPLRIATRRGGVLLTSAWERLKIFDRLFLDVRRDKSFYHALAEHGKIRRIVTDDEICYAMEHPPSGTRAEARDRRMAELICRDDVMPLSVEWTHICYRYIHIRGIREMTTVDEYNEDPLSPDPRNFKILGT